MVRQIITPVQNAFTLQLPDEMLGKTVEIIAFEVDESSDNSSAISKDELSRKINRIKEITKNAMADLSNFKFNRDDANNLFANS